jgi:hypothetical protein
MRILQILVYLGLIFGLNGFANAQACGKFSVVVDVQNESGKPIGIAVVQLKPINIDETNSRVFERDRLKPSKFMMAFLEGQELREFHRLIVSADGYKSSENELKIVSCDNKYITVKLVEINSRSEAIWNFYNRIVVQVADENNQNIEKSWLTVTRDGKDVSVFLIENGYLNIKFFTNGVYDAQLKAKGFQNIQFKVDSTKVAEQTLKFRLKKAPEAVLTGIVKLNKKIIQGAVIKIRDADYNEYLAKTDEKGIYQLILPFGKYFIYSTVSDKCWMCAEFYRKDFLIDKKGEIKLDIELQFYGEG